MHKEGLYAEHEVWKREVQTYWKKYRKHWQAWVSASLGGLIALWQGGGGVIPSWLLWLIAISGVLWSGLATWREEHRLLRAESLKTADLLNHLEVSKTHLVAARAEAEIILSQANPALSLVRGKTHITYTGSQIAVLLTFENKGKSPARNAVMTVYCCSPKMPKNVVDFGPADIPDELLPLEDFQFEINLAKRAGEKEAELLIKVEIDYEIPHGTKERVNKAFWILWNSEKEGHIFNPGKEMVAAFQPCIDSFKNQKRTSITQPSSEPHKAASPQSQAS